MDANKTLHKISVAVEGGFLCAKCGYETVTFDGSTPKVCGHCGKPAPVLKWKNRITNHVKVEILPVK